MKKKKQICFETETEKEIIEEKAKNEKMTVNAYFEKDCFDDSVEMENDITKLSSKLNR